MKKIKILFFIGVSCFLVSCVGPKAPSMGDAKAFMDQYFEKLKLNSFTEIEPFYSDDSFAGTSRESWEEKFNETQGAMGGFISADLESWSVRSVASTTGSGRYFSFVYNSSYENKNVKETFVLFIPKGSTEIKIKSHDYEAGELKRDEPQIKRGPDSVAFGGGRSLKSVI